MQDQWRWRWSPFYSIKSFTKQRKRRWLWKNCIDCCTQNVTIYQVKNHYPLGHKTQALMVLHELPRCACGSFHECFPASEVPVETLAKKKNKKKKHAINHLINVTGGPTWAKQPLPSIRFLSPRTTGAVASYLFVFFVFFLKRGRKSRNWKGSFSPLVLHRRRGEATQSFN